MHRKSDIFQWAQLLTLAAVHFLVDLFPGMLPTILPEVRQRFAFTLTMAVAVLTTLNISCNLFQILTGHMRPEKKKPLFMPLGLLLAASLCLMPLLPSSNGLFVTIPIIILALISGLGVAIAHPEGLRGVHNLDRIKPSVSTAVFMTGGFLGYASGGWISTLVVSLFGLEGLLMVFILPLVGILLLWALKIR
ncbi:MAG: MFS transporter, partial [Planctomycetota bacterium]